ncbi:MAG: tetratricopeptide repeat protein [Chitinophagaceae bacterium]|nr:tetratricopeptide repeat protein [Chitinophagaceae bacterium]
MAFTYRIVFLIACSNDDASNPYAELLASPPYAAISDSIRDYPRESELYFRRAVLLNGNQHAAPALADFQKAWELDKQEKYAVGIGNIWLTSRPDSAASFVEEALKELPESLFLKLLLARAYEANKKMDESIRVLDQILEEYPKQVNAYILKAEILQGMDDRQGAAAQLEKAYALLPGNRQLAEELAYEYAETKNPRALVLTDSLIKVDSAKQFVAPFYIKGNYFANTGNRKAAIEWYDKTIQRDHRYLNAYIEKGKLLLDENQTEKAFAVFKLANTISPAFADAWYWMGKCQEKMGDKEEAKLNYKKAYSLDPEFLEAKIAAEGK